ncbi:hypothetical protein D3C71_384380 [compost metagenome]
MAMLSQQIHVARRFTRAVRVDDNFADASVLDGYVCSQSTVEVLLSMARHKADTGHGAFTWTGPYGSGKSSLAIALATLAAGSEQAGTSLLASVSSPAREELVRGFRPSQTPWRIAPIVGSRTDAAPAIETALNNAIGATTGLKRGADEALAQWAVRIAADPKREGLILFLDEMGKFLEHAARGGGDVHIFQELAEAAARAEGRLLIVGILHQAFDEYAQRLAREARDEWLKIQGRYLDIAVNLAAEEQIDLLGRAIEGFKPPADHRTRAVAAALKTSRLGSLDAIDERLAACWPLHPVVAALIGPITRRRFGQNQRSLFGFLTSAEPFGFQAHLNEAEVDDNVVYPVARLWDYLHANLESAILASPDGHRWATALDALHRAEARDAGPDHIALLKAVALIDLFKDRSGLTASMQVLATTMPADLNVEAILNDLKKWSVIVFRAHSGAFAIYAGSDFDIEAAVEEVRRTGVNVDFKRLARQASLQPILAKRHYEQTGALRWFEVELVPLHDADERIRTYVPAPGAAGLFLLAVSAQEESQKEAIRTLDAALENADARLVVCGWTRDSLAVREMAADLAALEQVRANRPELEGDAIARREIDARLARLSIDLEDRLGEAINSVAWRLPKSARDSIDVRVSGPAGLSILASRLADWRYPLAPRLPNELVNRTKPSSSAQGAVRALLYGMTERSELPRLGIDGYPAEAGLHISLLESTGLHQWDEESERWRFVAPTSNDPARLLPLWNATDAFLQPRAAGASAAEIYHLWRSPPFGVRGGLLPILMGAYLLTRAGRSAVYLDGVFRPSLDTFLVDRLLQEPASVSLRTVELTEVDVAYIAAMAEMLSTSDERVPPTSLEVARALVKEIRDLPAWTLRTSRLTSNALRLRDRAKVSNDPNRLLLEDVPAAVGVELGSLSGIGIARKVSALMAELRDAYPTMLRELESALKRELRVRGDGDLPLEALQRRSINVQGLTGNFRLDALATRLSTYTGRLEELEGLASLAANRPPRDWVDRDVDAARVELAALAQQFLKAEGFGHLKGRADGWVGVAVYISDPSYPEPQAHEIDLSASDRLIADALSARIHAMMLAEGTSRDIAIAAIANLGLALHVPADDEGAAQVA